MYAGVFRRLVTLIGFAVVLGLHGCVNVEPRSESVAVEQARLARMEYWKLEGRIAVQTAEDAWQANLIWEHDAGQDRLRVFGPLSQGMVSIVLQDDLVLINEGNGSERISRDPDALLKEKLGFSIPLKNLRYWVLGVPAPFEPSETDLDSEGRLQRLRQSGWSLDYERYGHWERFVLPQKLVIRGRTLKLKLFADDWTVRDL